MQKLDLVGINLVKILMELVKDQDLCKMIYYKESNCLSMPDLLLPQNNLINTSIFPYPFDDSFEESQTCQVNVYYPVIYFKNNEVIVNEEIIFDIVCRIDLWLISGGLIRPYEIMSQIFNIFSKRSIDTIGILNFDSARHLYINKSYGAIRLIAKMMTI